MIISAGKYRLWDLPSMPEVSAGVTRFLSPLIIEKLQVNVVSGFAQKIPIAIKTLGAIQPLTARELVVKPEGERSWSWYRLHTSVNVDLKTNDRVRIRNTVYKIMAKWDWSRSGYLEFHCILDFEDNDTSTGGS
jgi:hypothetical protein